MALQALFVLAAWMGASPLLGEETARAAGQEAGQVADWQSALDTIQRTCLRAYPPELLRTMTAEGEADAATGGTDEIPQSIDASPSDQQDFLTSTAELEKGLFYPIRLEDMLEAFEEYVKPGVRFLDLGSGDGRAVFLANVMGADATGIEYDPGMVAVSRKAMEALGETVDTERIHFIEGDFFKQPWSGYDVIFYFDLSSFEHHELRQKIARELDPGARLLVGHQQATFPGLALENRFKSVHVYRQPQSSMRDTSLAKRCTLEVEELHRFLENWRNGAVADNDDNFKRLSDVVSRSFHYIGPDGKVMRHRALLNQLRRDWGRWRPGNHAPGHGRIRIENLRVRLIEGPLVLVSYDEWQDVGGASQGKSSSALFRLEHGLPNRVAWMHLHQSALLPAKSAEN